MSLRLCPHLSQPEILELGLKSVSDRWLNWGQTFLVLALSAYKNSIFVNFFHSLYADFQGGFK